MTPALAVPFDEHAEEQAVGTALSTHHGYQLAARHITADDFYRPDLARLFDACSRLAHMPGISLDSEHERLSHAARSAHVPLSLCRHLAATRSLMWDTRGRYPLRVARAARQRDLMRAAADLYNRLGQPAPPGRGPDHHDDQDVLGLTSKLDELARAGT